MLSRVYRPLGICFTPRGVNALAMGCRYASSQPASKTSAPSTAQPFANTPGSASKVIAPSPRKAALKDFDFKKAQMNLPIRMYSKAGVFASKVYAIAEHLGGSKNKVQDVNKVADSLRTLYGVFKLNPKVGRIFFSPQYSRDEKKAVINSIAKAKNVHALAAGLAKRLVKVGKPNLLKQVAKDFIQLKDARDEVVKVSLTIASKDQARPKPETIRNLLRYGPKAQIKLDVKVDPSIEGGALLSSHNRFLDLSFKKQLSVLRTKLQKKQNDLKASRRAKFQAALAKVEQAERNLPVQEVKLDIPPLAPLVPPGYTASQ